MEHLISFDSTKYWMLAVCTCKWYCTSKEDNIVIDEAIAHANSNNGTIV